MHVDQNLCTMSVVCMDNSDRDNNGSSSAGAEDQSTPVANAAAAKPLDPKAERAKRLAAALRTNLRRRKMPGAAARPEPKDRN